MTPTIESFRNDATRALLSQADSILEAWNQLSFTSAMEANTLRQAAAGLVRARREFEAKLFFVVVFGPLKAGKSTLANALAREYISPTGFGMETTRRPSIIVQGEPGIDQYFKRDPDTSIQKEDFDHVADFLRGLIGNETLSERVERVSYPLSRPELERKLTHTLAREPLITVLRVPGGKMINGRIALVDMPGLDGEKSNWGKDPIHEWIIQRADFFFFVQSSVAALNHDTKQFLQEVVNKSKKPPMWVVQNIIDAKHWLPIETRNKEAQEQQRLALERVMVLLGIPAHEPITSVAVNLGMAWDSIHLNQPEWMKQAKFGEFEDEIVRQLHSQQAIIQERNSIKGFSKALETCSHSLSEVRKTISDFEHAYQAFLDDLTSCHDQFSQNDYRSVGQAGLKAEMIQIGNTALEAWYSHLEAAAMNLKQKFNREMPGKKLNEAMERFAEETGSKGRRHCFSASAVLSAYQKAAMEHTGLVEQRAIERVNERLQERKLPPLPVPKPPSGQDLPSVADNPLQIEKQKEHPKWNPWWNTSHDAHEVESHIARQVTLFRIEIKDRFESWAANALAKHLTEYCERRRAEFQETLAHLQKQFEERKKPEVDQANEAKRLIKIIEAGLDKMSPLANASAEST